VSMLGKNNSFDKVEIVIGRVALLAVLLIHAVEFVLRAASYVGQ